MNLTRLKIFLLIVFGCVLTLPTIWIAFMGITATVAAAGPIAFGMWLFVGMPPLLGAVAMFVLAIRLGQTSRIPD